VKSKCTDRFWRSYHRLPERVKKQARKAYQLFQRNPNYPSLQFKRLETKDPHYSARISRDYRVVGLVDGDEILWDMIGTHADYDEYVKRLP